MPPRRRRQTRGGIVPFIPAMAALAAAQNVLKHGRGLHLAPYGSGMHIAPRGHGVNGGSLLLPLALQALRHHKII